MQSIAEKPAPATSPKASNGKPDAGVITRPSGSNPATATAPEVVLQTIQITIHSTDEDACLRFQRDFSEFARNAPEALRPLIRVPSNTTTGSTVVLVHDGSPRQSEANKAWHKLAVAFIELSRYVNSTAVVTTISQASVSAKMLYRHRGEFYNDAGHSKTISDLNAFLDKLQSGSK